MPRETHQTLDLCQLQQGLPASTPSFGAALAEACAICLSDQGHHPGITLAVLGDFSSEFTLLYPEVTDQMRRCWNDEEYATEQAAYGVALLLMQQLTNLTVIERSRKGTGFDYWLGTASKLDSQPFKKTARLEVSGIRQGSYQQIRTRVKLKIAQVKPTDNLAPAYIAVIEFSQPTAQIVR
ncbi:MAG: hypothetical protein AAFZ17_21970 [Cyanobacteria bacterium J06650_10]